MNQHDYVSIASLRLIDIETANHQVTWLYTNLSLDANYKHFMLKYLSLIFSSGYTYEQLNAMFSSKEIAYPFFTQSIPLITADLADKYILFFNLYTEAIKDKIESYKQQVSYIKQITTGQPLIYALDLEIHHTGWYVVIY